jgi:hypothetical protein
MKILYFESAQYEQRERKLLDEIKILRGDLLKLKEASANDLIVVGISFFINE